MKQSWIIGVISLWILIFTAEMMATSGTAFSSNMTASMTALAHPSMANYSNIFSSTASIISQVGTYFMVFISALTLYSPTVFAGNWIWFWAFICFPISISFIIVIITILRGVHAS